MSWFYKAYRTLKALPYLVAVPAMLRQQRQQIDRLVAFQREIGEFRKLIRERTTIGIDISAPPDDSYVIVIGSLNGVDYVRTYSVTPNQLSHIVDVLTHIKKQGRLRYIDAPPMVRAVLERYKD